MDFNAYKIYWVIVTPIEGTILKKDVITLAKAARNCKPNNGVGCYNIIHISQAKQML